MGQAGSREIEGSVAHVTHALGTAHDQEARSFEDNYRRDSLSQLAHPLSVAVVQLAPLQLGYRKMAWVPYMPPYGDCDQDVQPEVLDDLQRSSSGG